MVNLNGSRCEKEIKYWLLIILFGCGVAFAGCHSSADKRSVLKIQKRDTVKVITESKKKAPDRYVILDTVAGKDTIRVVLYNNTMIKCTLNNLSDTYNAANEYQYWDTSYANYSKYNVAPIIVPGKRNPVKFILNDTMLLMSIESSNTTGGMMLFLLSKTKNSLKFASEDSANPIILRPFYIYVDIRNNIIIDHDYREIYDDYDHAGDEEYGRYLIYRFRIVKKRFIQTDLDASFFNGFEKLDMEDNPIGDSRTFYNIILKNENWKRDRYDSSSYQKVIALDTVAGKNKIQLAFNNRGNVICKLNGKCDTTSWGESWEGYEGWRAKKPYGIIVPGENKPRAFILNDSILLFTLVNSGRKAELFLFNRRDCILDSTIINDYSNFIYVDLKKNTILSCIDSNYMENLKEDFEEAHHKGAPYEICEYKIYKNDFKEESRHFGLFKDYFDSVAPASFDEFQDFYLRLAQVKNWQYPSQSEIVLYFMNKYSFYWYIYYEIYLNENKK